VGGHIDQVGWLDVREAVKSGTGAGRVVTALRRAWVFVASWAMLAAGFALEPLLVLGPGFVALLTTEVAPLALLGLIVVAGFRLARGAVRGVRRSDGMRRLSAFVAVAWIPVLPLTARIRPAA